MPTITLPDGSRRQYPAPLTVAEIAASIGSGLARAALAAEIDGRLVDTAFRIGHDVRLRIVTADDPEGLEVLRHSSAHLLAQAVKRLFPSAQVTIGPVIEDGFYYDFGFERAFTPEDVAAIEAEMRQLAQEDHSVSREVLGRAEAIELFRGMGEHYKAEIIASIPEGEELSLYRQGGFVDLCRGPHVPSTGRLRAFKLTKVAGAYWRGDSQNAMLQRIYGTAWPDKKALDDYLHRLEQAERRDHRRVGRELDLFHMQPEAPGMVFWHPKGWVLYQEVQDYIRDRLRRHGYEEVHTPEVVDRSLWERSGHWDKFREVMFTTSSENRDYAVKPMNCPCHVQIFNQGIKSYRDLPLRLAEFGSCHRNEPSGTLHGLMRVRHFVQDDAHIFCTEDQIESEVSAFIDLLYSVYADFGFDKIITRLSTRPEARVGSDAVWDKAEAVLRLAVEHKGLAYAPQPGEGAFYGPKIEFSLTDCIGRVWQCGTIQVDFSTPERLGAQYVAEDGGRRVPVMLHRAILGSLERFIGILIEEHAGIMPLWLAPLQVAVLCITDAHAEYAREVEALLKDAGIRAVADLRNEKIGLKIREHTLSRVPYLAIVGGREVADRSVAVRTRAGEDQGSMPIAAFAERIESEMGPRASSRPVSS
ncbi:MAG: threonine--tRNA ligase [Beggiatoa sp.]|nr:threonine--tRNA ligase [Beggiatoa sp.]